MPYAPIPRSLPRATRGRRHRARRSAVWRLAGRAIVTLRGAPLAVRIIVVTVLLVSVWAAVNWMVQVARKPTELFFPVSGSLGKPPALTWQRYGPLFKTHSTAVITPELLAALAQVEGSGNPVARTYWRWRFSWNPFELYRPASSAVGMFQMTDGTFRRPGATASTATSSSRTVPGTICGRVGSTRSTRASCPVMRWR